jgi:hypothetical protein
VNGEAADEQSTSELKRPVRRESAPVDIAVADMVVAALTLATNGADDVIYGREQLTEDDLHWVDASDPTPYLPFDPTPCQQPVGRRQTSVFPLTGDAPTSPEGLFP